MFEVRDAVTDATLFIDTLDSLVLDNTPSVALLNIAELMANACNPIMGWVTRHYVTGSQSRQVLYCKD